MSQQSSQGKIYTFAARAYRIISNTIPFDQFPETVNRIFVEHSSAIRSNADRNANVMKYAMANAMKCARNEIKPHTQKKTNKFIYVHLTHCLIDNALPDNLMTAGCINYMPHRCNVKQQQLDRGSFDFAWLLCATPSPSPSFGSVFLPLRAETCQNCYIYASYMCMNRMCHCAAAHM